MAQIDSEKVKIVDVAEPPNRNNKKPGHIRGRDGKIIPLEEKKFKSIFDKLGTDTIMAIKTLKSLGGFDFDKLEA